MRTIEIIRQIDAPLEFVFQTISDVRNFSKAVPHITNIEFLTDQEVGKGTRFLETRDMNGRVGTVELAVTDYVEDERVQFLSEAGGIIWDTIFTVSQTEVEPVELKMVMAVSPIKLVGKLMWPIMKRPVTKAIAADMDMVKSYCEGQDAKQL